MLCIKVLIHKKSYKFENSKPCFTLSLAQKLGVLATELERIVIQEANDAH